MTNQQGQWTPSLPTASSVANADGATACAPCAPGQAGWPRDAGVGTPPPWLEGLMSLRADELRVAAAVLQRIAEACDALATVLAAAGDDAPVDKASSSPGGGGTPQPAGEETGAVVGSSHARVAGEEPPNVAPELDGVRRALAGCDVVLESAVPHARCTPLSLAGWFAGDRYAHLGRAFRALRRAANNGGRVELFAWDWPLDDLNATAQWFQMLEEARVLRHRGYDRRSRRFVVVPDWEMPWVRGFLCGGWMEHWAAEVIRRRVFGKRCQEAPIARNVKVALSPAHQAEFDVFAVLPDGELLWVELKSGAVDRNHLDSYARRRHRLGLPPQRALVACTRLDETLERDIRARQLTPVSLDTLGDSVAALAQQASTRPLGVLGAALAPLLQTLGE